MLRFPMTPEGFKQLQDELQWRKTTERSRIKEAIAEARAHGDLSENAEYHAAREQQAFNEGRILDVEGKLQNSQVIDISTMTNTGRVVFGTTVVLENCDSGKEIRYRLVGEDEADLKQGKISVTSPIARALISKSAGDVVVVKAPGGEVEYEILEVLY